MNTIHFFNILPGEILNIILRALNAQDRLSLVWVDKLCRMTVYSYLQCIGSRYVHMYNAIHEKGRDFMRREIRNNPDYNRNMAHWISTIDHAVNITLICKELDHSK